MKKIKIDDSNIEEVRSLGIAWTDAVENYSAEGLSYRVIVWDNGENDNDNDGTDFWYESEDFPTIAEANEERERIYDSLLTDESQQEDVLNYYSLSEDDDICIGVSLKCIGKNPYDKFNEYSNSQEDFITNEDIYEDILE